MYFTPLLSWTFSQREASLPSFFHQASSKEEFSVLIYGKREPERPPLVDLQGEGRGKLSSIRIGKRDKMVHLRYPLIGHDIFWGRDKQKHNSK